MGHSEKILNGEDEKYNSLSRHIFNKDNNKPYVFISYKSDNDTTVLSTIVYNLVNQYGLRVYFDADFAKKGALWTTQVQENMKNPYCRGVLAFVSNRYTTSYATIMELMYSQTTEADTQPRKRDKDEGEGKPVVPVNLESIKPLYELEQTYSTGLGDQTYDEYHDDGTKEKVENLSYKKEKENFDEYFDEMVEREYIKGKGKRLYKKKKLEWRACREIFNEMYSLFGQNENRYNEEDKNFYENLYETIKDSIGEDIFDLSLIGKLSGGKPVIAIKFIRDNEETIKEIKKEALLDEPDHGKKEGYEFIGWFDEKNNSKWNFNDPVHEDMTLVAKWKKTTDSNDDLHSKLAIWIEQYESYFSGWLNASKENKKEKAPRSGNKMVDMVCSDIPEYLNRNLLTQYDKYISKGSCGVGVWAKCPWLAIFNTNITDTTTKGVYIVYLLNPNKKVLYLTLNQGVESITKEVEERKVKEGKDFIKKLGFKKIDDYINNTLQEKAIEIRKKIGTAGFSTERIDTGKEGYDYGCICSRKYKLESLPNDTELVNDLKDMLKLYSMYASIN